MSFFQNIAGAQSNDAPAWAINGDQVVLVWKAQDSAGVYVALAKGRQPTPDVTTGQYAFSAPQQITGPPIPGVPGIKGPIESIAGVPIGTSAEPAIASHDNKLYLFFKGESDDKIYVTTSSDGRSWATAIPLEIAGQVAQTSHAPTVVSANGMLYLFYKGASDNKIWWSTFSNGSWAGQQVVSPATGDQPQTSDSPAVAISGKTIYLAVVGVQSQTVFWLTYNGS